MTKPITLLSGLLFLIASLPGTGCRPSPEGFALTIKQITAGDAHQLFGYIGQSKTIPWNASGRYILGLRTAFHDRMQDGVYVKSEGLSCGGYTRGDLRIDPAPRWNRTSDALLVPGWTASGTRQMHVIEIVTR